MRRLVWIAALAAMVMAGCELVVKFDSSRIPADMGPDGASDMASD